MVAGGTGGDDVGYRLTLMNKGFRSHLHLIHLPTVGAVVDLLSCIGGAVGGCDALPLFPCGIRELLLDGVLCRPHKDQCVLHGGVGDTHPLGYSLSHIRDRRRCAIRHFLPRRLPSPDDALPYPVAYPAFVFGYSKECDDYRCKEYAEEDDNDAGIHSLFGKGDEIIDDGEVILAGLVDVEVEEDLE